MTENPAGSGNFQTNNVTFDEYTPDPKLVEGLKVVGAINEASRPANPFADLVNYALGGIILIAGAIARHKTQKAKETQTLLTTVVQGVEAAGNAETKAAIRDVATKKGVEGKLAPLVYDITRR